MKNPTKTVVCHFRLPKTLIKWLKKVSEDNGRNLRGEVIYRLEKSKEFLKDANS